MLKIFLNILSVSVTKLMELYRES